MCLDVDPAEDRIKPCACSGSVALVHRECLDRWRTLSPHPDALWACELCKSKYKLVFRETESDCWRKTRYALAIIADLLVFVGVIFGLYLLAGFIGDLSLNKAVINIFCPKDSFVNNTCALPFIFEPNLWTGRIWFYGFIVFFFVLGVIGCCFACCFRDEGSHGDYGHGSFGRGDCWWLCCGPSYYNGYYYYSPYGYWGFNDLCCFMCWHHTAYHHHGCNMNACSGCYGCVGAGDCNGSDSSSGATVLLVILLVVIAIFVVCGIVFGTMIGAMIFGKIIRRHLSLLEKRADATTYIVADLNNPAQVAEADRQANEGLAPLQKVVVTDPQIIGVGSVQNKPVGKGLYDVV